MVFLGLSVEAFSQNPLPDIKVNGEDGPVVIARPDSIKISVALNNYGIADLVDCWFAAATPHGVLFLTPDGWSNEIFPAYQGHLFQLPGIELLNIPTSGFPVGTYGFYFGVDTHMDASITSDCLYYDNAVVNLKNGENSSGCSGYAFDKDKIQLLSASHSLKCLYVTALGLPSQIDLLPDGRIVIADPNNDRIVIADGENISTLVLGQNINAYVAVALPDGSVCYSTSSGEIYKINPDTSENIYVGELYSPGHTNALGSDSRGNIYAVGPSQRLYKFTADGTRSIILQSLGFENLGYAITDIDVAPDGTIYIGGFRKVVAVDAESNLTIIADDLHNEPVWVEVTPDGYIYINELSRGLQRYNPANKTLRQVRIDNFSPFGDIIAPSAQEIIFYDFEVLYEYNFQTGSSDPLLKNYGNSFAFAAGIGKAYFATPCNPPVLNSVMMGLDWNCNMEEYSQVSFKKIISIDVGLYNTIYLNSLSGIYTIDDNNIPHLLTALQPNCIREISVDNEGNIFAITSDFNNMIEVYRYNSYGMYTTLPISFNARSFDSRGICVHDAAIDVSDEGWIAMIVTGLGSYYNDGPYYQRVYRANSDGSNLTLLANLDCQRVGGMVDIAVAPDGNIYVLAVTGSVGSSDVIYRLGSTGENLMPFVDIKAGNDPKSIDVDANGNLWFSTTTGIFVAEPN